MKPIRNLNTSTNHVAETKFWQGWLNTFEGEKLKIDGDYGGLTKNATARYQAKYNLVPDGNAGQITLNHAGFLSTNNSKIVVLKIPFNRISQADVLVKDGQAYSCEKFAKEGSYDIVVNGAFHVLKTRKLVQLVMQKGKVLQWGMGYTGLAFPTPFDKAYLTSYGNAMNKPIDLNGGAPVLINNYKKDTESINSFSKAIYNEITKRNCMGVTDNSIVLFFSISNCTMNEMLNEGLYQKVKDMIGLDGGASQSIWMGNNWVIKTTRQIPACIGFNINKNTNATPPVPSPTPSQPSIPPLTSKSKWIQDAGHGGSDSGAMNSGNIEKTYTLEAALYVDKRLKEHGISSTCTRTSDTTLSNANRTAKVKQYDNCISHHFNAGGGTGAETIHSKYSDGKFAQMIIDELKADKYPVRAIPVYSKKLANGQDYYFMHRDTGNAKTTIVEYEFVDGVNREKIKDKAYREGMYECVVKAVCKYEGITYKPLNGKEPPKETPKEHWAKPALDSLVKKGIIVSPEQHLDLDVPISKGEIFVMLDKTTR